MINRFAEFVLRSRTHAIWVAALAFLLPLASWISSVVIALVTLRHGWREGFWIVLSLTVVVILVFTVLKVLPMGFVPFMLIGPLLAWGLAGVLRTCRSWSQVLVAAFYLGGLLVLCVLAMGSDSNAVTDNLAEYVQHNAELVAMIHWLTDYFIGLQVALILLSGFISLTLARGIQAMLFNPGGLYPELLQIRLPMHTALMAVVLFTAAMFQVTWAKHLVPIVSLIYFLAGLSLLHFAVRNMAPKAWPWLVGFYGFLLLFFIYVFMVVATLGVVDTLMNVRRQLSMRSS